MPQELATRRDSTTATTATDDQETRGPSSAALGTQGNAALARGDASDLAARLASSPNSISQPLHDELMALSGQQVVALHDALAGVHLQPTPQQFVENLYNARHIQMLIDGHHYEDPLVETEMRGNVREYLATCERLLAHPIVPQTGPRRVTTNWH